MLTAEFPDTTPPAFGIAVPTDGQGVTIGFVQAALQYFHQGAALDAVAQVYFKWIDVGGQVTLFPEVIKYIFVAGFDVVGVDANEFGQFPDKLFGVGVLVLVIPIDVGQPLGFAPHGQAVFAPEQRISPTWNGFARIPFAHAVMDKAAFTKNILELVDEDIAQLAFFHPISSAVPLLGFHIVNRYKSRFTAHGEAHIARL